ncbi:hypothetical protein CIK89_05220 [Prevotella sp. P4-119]|nr:hypothetical protein CIK89_05220 [Prevotella sp. P4-119]
MNFQLCSRLREALVFDLVFFASAKLKSELSALLSASGSLREAFGKPSGWVRDGFGICEYGSLCYSPKQVPIKSQLSPIIFPQSCELDGRRMGDEGEGEKKSKWKNVNLRLSFRHRLRKKRQYFNI